MISIKRMVLTLPARGDFRIRTRYKCLGGGIGLILPHTARAGRTCEALAIFLDTWMFGYCHSLRGVLYD